MLCIWSRRFISGYGGFWVIKAVLVGFFRHHCLPMNLAYDKFRHYSSNNLSIEQRTKVKKMRRKVDNDIDNLWKHCQI